MARRVTYTDEQLAQLYVVLETNEGNIKRTARDTGFPESSVRRWKEKWDSGETPPPGVEIAITDFVTDAERVRNKALAAIEKKIPGAKVSELTSLVGILTDKIDRARGLATGRVEHVHSLPPADEIRKVLGAVVQGALQRAKEREEDIIDAEFVEEQVTKALPAPRQS